MNTIQTIANQGVFNSGVMKGRRYRVIETQSEFVPEIWDMIKDYAGINKQGRWDLALKVAKVKAKKCLEESNARDAELALKKQQERERLNERLRQEQLARQAKEAQRQTKTKPKIWLGGQNRDDLFAIRLQDVRVGDFVFFTPIGKMPKTGTVVKVNEKSITVDEGRGDKCKVVKTLFSIIPRDHIAFASGSFDWGVWIRNR